MPVVVQPAVSKTYRVTWFETTLAGVGARNKPHRREVFEVQARSGDQARALAKTHVERRGYMASAVSFSQRPCELVIYTPKKEL